jgi:hypothetical protein
MVLRLLRALTVGMLATAVLVPVAAAAESGHFVGKPTCTDNGTFLDCTGKVTSPAGTTIRIEVSAAGVADVTCTNPGGEVAPGQSFAVEATGSTGDQPTLTKGKFAFTVGTNVPIPPPGSCPNPMWEARVTDVHFTSATLTLFQISTVADTITVRVS